MDAVPRVGLSAFGGLDSALALGARTGSTDGCDDYPLVEARVCRAELGEVEATFVGDSRCRTANLVPHN